MFDTMKVAREIREARIARNMTQMNLADEMGVSYQAVSNWERGNSMPDIGKLEELCGILDVSLEQLLGVKRQVENVRRVMDYANGKMEEPVSLEAIGDAAPLAKPDMIGRLAENVPDEEVELGKLCGLAPFLEGEALGRLAVRAKEVELGKLCGLAPFLKKETVDILAERIDMEEVKLGKLCGLAPFMGREALGRLAVRVKRVELGELRGLAPFLEKETVAALADRIEGKLNLNELLSLMPFMKKEDLERLTAQTGQ